VKRCDLQGHPA